LLAQCSDGSLEFSKGGVLFEKTTTHPLSIVHLNRHAHFSWAKSLKEKKPALDPPLLSEQLLQCARATKPLFSSPGKKS
jgi:hypothetical protein